MEQELDRHNSTRDSERAEGVAEVQALIKRYYIDFGVEILERIGHKDVKSESTLTILAVIDRPAAFRGADIAITIRKSDKPFSEIISKSLSALPKRLQKHLYEPGYRYLGIIFWTAGAARENPPADYSTLYMQSSVDLETFDSFCKLLLESSSNRNSRQFVNIRALGLESDEFIKHEQLSVAITGVKVSVQCDSHPS